MDLDFDRELAVCEAYIKKLKRSDWSISDAVSVRLEALRRLVRLREIMARCFECGGWTDDDCEDMRELLNIKEG